MGALTEHTFGAATAWTVAGAGVLALVAIIASLLLTRRGALASVRPLLTSIALPVVLLTLAVVGGLAAVPGEWEARIAHAAAYAAGVLFAFIAAHLGASAHAAPVSRTTSAIAFALGTVGAAVLPLAAGALVLGETRTFAGLTAAAGFLTVAVALGAGGAIARTASATAATGGFTIAGAEGLDRGAGLGALLSAVTASALGAALVTAPTILGAEGILAAFAAVAAALLAAVLGPLLSTVLGRDRGRDRVRGPGRNRDRGRGASGLGAALATVVAAGGVAVAAILLAPARYRELNFAGAGSPDVLLGPTPLERAGIWPQLDQLPGGAGDFIAGRDQAVGALETAYLIVLDGTDPRLLLAVAVGVGALLTLLVALVARAVSATHRASVHGAGRSGRLGSGFALLAIAASALLWAVALLLLVAAAITGLAVLARGVPELTLALAATAATGGVIALAALGTAHRATDDDRTDALGTGAASDTAVLAVSVLAGLGMIGPVRYQLLAVLPHAQTLLDEALLQDAVLESAGVLAGLLLGGVAVLTAAGVVLDTTRRAATGAVLIAGDPGLADPADGEETADGEEAAAGDGDLLWSVQHTAAGRGAVLPPVLAVLGALAVTVGLGVPAGLAYGTGALLTALALGCAAALAAAASTGAERVVASGRYDGPDSGTHYGLLQARTVTGALRRAVLATGVPIALIGLVVPLLAGRVVQQLTVADPNPYLRLGVAVGAVAIVLAVLSYTDSVAQPDLGDAGETLGGSLFGRDGETGADRGDETGADRGDEHRAEALPGDELANDPADDGPADDGTDDDPEYIGAADGTEEVVLTEHTETHRDAAERPGTGRDAAERTDRADRAD